MQTMHQPPCPERLIQEKLPMSFPQFDVLDELRNFLCENSITSSNKRHSNLHQGH